MAARHILPFTGVAIVATAAISAAWAGWSRASIVLLVGLVAAFLTSLLEPPILRRSPLIVATVVSLAVAVASDEEFRPGLGDWWDRATRLDVLMCLVALLVAAPGLAQGARVVREQVRSRRLRLVVAGVSTVVVASTVAGMSASLEEPQTLQPTHLGTAHRLRERLRMSYPHWGERGHDLDALWQQHRGRLLESVGGCAPEAEFCRPAFHVLRDLFARLDNGHTEIVIRDEIGVPPVLTRHTADGAAIYWVDPHAELSSTCTPETGDLVVAVDGEPIECAAASLPRHLVGGRGSRAREISAYRHVLWGAPGTDVDVTLVKLGGSHCTVRLRRESAELWSAADAAPSELVASDLSSDGIGYLYVEGFAGGSGFVTAVDRALERVGGSRALVLDLRGNGGGKVSSSEYLAARFLEAPLRVGQVCRLGCFFGTCFDLCDDVELEPGRPTYSGRVAVLVDEQVASAAEYVAYVLCRHRGARCFGVTTAGSVDYVSSQEIGPARVSISSARFHPSAGPEIEGQGIEPHEVIELRAQDIRDNTDPVRTAAEVWLRQAAEASLP